MTVDTYDVGVLQCGFTKYPESPVEAKFSIPYTVAAALIRGRVTQGEFTMDLISDPLVRYLATHTTVQADPLFTGRYPKRWGSRTTLHMKDGGTRVIQIDDMSGSTAAPLTEKQEMDKFMGLASAAFSEERCGQLMRDILRVDELQTLPVLA